MHKRTAVSFFSGVGGIDLGFEQTGKFDVVWANEFDKYAAMTYRLNFAKTVMAEKDIRLVESSEVPDADIFLAGFPCQAFSIAGYKKGFEDDRGTLFFDLLRLIVAKKPRVVFLENVRNLYTHDKGKTFRIIKESLEANGYKVASKVLNAKDYGNIPQNRERIYIVAFAELSDYERFKFPEPIPLEKSVLDMIDSNERNEDLLYTKEKYIQFPTIQSEVTAYGTVYQWRRKYVRANKNGVFPTLTANMGTGGHNVPLILTDYGIRKLSPRECFNVQGYPTEYILPNISRSHLYKQAGNSVVVPVIRRIAEAIYHSIQE